jgi:hypothetical protein
VVESSALLKRRTPKGYRGFESLPHRSQVNSDSFTKATPETFVVAIAEEQRAYQALESAGGLFLVIKTASAISLIVKQPRTVLGLIGRPTRDDHASKKKNYRGGE